jgi:hypothetical protein
VAGDGLACDGIQVRPWTVMAGLVQHCQ